MNKIARWILFSLGLLAFVFVFVTFARDIRPPADVRTVDDYEAWEPETLTLAESLPVQNGGRIKPLTTYAGFTMLKIYGARSMKITPEDDGEVIEIKPLEWMLDAFFRPQFSVQQPSFRVEDSDLLVAIGVDPRSKRDRYSYRDLELGRDRLFELARTYGQGAESAELTPLESQIIALAQNMQTYEHLLGVFDVARSGLQMVALEGSGSQQTDVSSVMATADVIRQVLQRSQTGGQEIPPHVQNLLQQILDGANRSKYGLFLFPPAGADDDAWLSPGDRLMNVMTQQTRDLEGSIKDIQSIEIASRAIFDGQAEFREKFSVLKADVVARAEARGEYRSVPLEASYYHRDWFLYALVFFLVGTLFAIAMWMVGSGLAGRILSTGVWLSSLAGLVYVVIPIAKRCIIMQRPPVGNLYDTIIFICAASIIFGAIIEWMTKRRIVLGLMPIMGVVLILLARLFEVGDAKDHMDPLVAVLRSNYWLTIHVITITLGYAAGLVTALISMVYVLLRGLRLDDGDKSLRRSLTRAVYGMVCLTLFLSLVGTVLGGIWANDSWGRFWGWDPKENGALLIVLATLAILHARMGGFLREWGVHLASISLAAVVIFSWWGVNLLGVGLHNYGFAKGGGYIDRVYGVIAVFMLFGFVAMIMDRLDSAKRKMTAPQSSDSSGKPGGGPPPMSGQASTEG